MIWSGTLLDESTWRQKAAEGPPLNVVQSHAVDDPILPFTGAEELRNLLIDSGHSVEFLQFRGGHTIPDAAIAATIRLINGVLSEAGPD